jgi:uridylate kinase
MAIKIGGTTVIDDSRNLVNINSVGSGSTTVVYYGDGSNLVGVVTGGGGLTAKGEIFFMTAR